MKIRVLPVVMVGIALLLTLKAAGLVLTGHYAFAEPPSARPQAVAATYRPSAAARLPGAPALNDDDELITGSVPKAAPKAAEEAKPAPEAPAAPAAEAEAAEPKPPNNCSLENKNPDDLQGAEKVLLDRLQSRRTELDARAHELDLRENLLRTAEKKIEDQLAELKSVEERLAALQTARNEEEAKKVKDLVVMYENMKPKEAAAIFDRLDMKVLVDVATQMNPKKTGDIIAKMEPASAERLTVALARRDTGNKMAGSDPATLPKIQGEAPK